MFVRVGFGLALAFTGFAHYQDPQYAESVGRGLGMLESLGMIWGYILPGLMILGGLLLAFGIYMEIAAYASALALASIPAGLILKSAITGISLEETMPPAMNALVWIIVLMLVVKKGCGSCTTGCACGPSCMCGPECGCCTPDAKPMAMKSSPVVSVKAPAKKVPVKKVSSKRK